MIARFLIPAPFDSFDESNTSEISLGYGETLFRQGESPWAIFLLVDGTAKLVRHTEAGRLVPIFRAGPGDTLAEASLFSTEYHCDCVAVTHARLLAFDKTAVMTRMSKDPEFALALTRRLSIQVQSYRRKLELLAITPAEKRVLAALADGWLQESVLAFAADIGLTHEATYRALASLVREGRARKTGRGRYVATSQ